VPQTHTHSAKENVIVHHTIHACPFIEVVRSARTANTHKKGLIDRSAQIAYTHVWVTWLIDKMYTKCQCAYMRNSQKHVTCHSTRAYDMTRWWKREHAHTHIKKRLININTTKNTSIYTNTLVTWLIDTSGRTAHEHTWKITHW